MVQINIYHSSLFFCSYVFFFFYCRQLPSLTQLHTLHLRNTQRTLSNMPNKLDNIETLTDLDLSHNNLPRSMIFSQNIYSFNLGVIPVHEDNKFN